MKRPGSRRRRSTSAACSGRRHLRVFYWRERSHPVDFVRVGETVTAIEVKSDGPGIRFPGVAAFGAVVSGARKLLVGGDGIAVEEFLEKPVEHWVKR